MRRTKLMILFLVIALTGAGLVTSSDTFFQIRKNFTTINEVVSEVSRNYVVEVDAERMMRRGVNAMLETLDPYTVLIDESQTSEIDIMTRGTYAGVGIEVGARAGQFVVIAPIEGYSAHRKGVRAGDTIIQVDDIKTDELTMEDLQGLLRGEPGTSVTLIIERFGIEDPLTFELERERIEVRNVSFAGFADKEAGVAYVLLRRFTQNAGNDIAEALSELEEQSEVNSLILDLRNNPGGLLSEAVNTVELFLPEGLEVVRTEGKAESMRQAYRTERPAMFGDRQLVVLQNSGSASSSEIVTGALQDHDRAVIVGETSFGKGLVQIVRPLSYNMALKITTSKYFVPSGRSIQSVDYNAAGGDEERERIAFETKNGRTVYQAEGILPDVVIEQPSESMVEVALHRGNHFFQFANRYVSENPEADASQLSSEELFDKFLEYLDEIEFSYESRSERMIASLEEQLLAEMPQADVRYIHGLRSQVDEMKETALIDSKDPISTDLLLEIVSRYEGREGRQKKSLMFDPLVIRSLEILGDRSQYDALLAGDK